MRDKLIEILRKPIYPHELADPIEALADYLLDNGVVVLQAAERDAQTVEGGLTMKKYEISNIGCDDTTEGVFYFTDEQADFLNTVFTELNTHSEYGCMPTIFIKRVKED